MDGEEGKDVSMWTGKREKMAGYGRGRGNYCRVGEKSERMAEYGRGKGKGLQSVEREEGKDGKVCTGKREKISE